MTKTHQPHYVRHPPRPTPRRRTATAMAFGVAALAGGCATLEVRPLPEPIRPPSTPAEVADALSPPPVEETRTLVLTPAPAPGTVSGPGVAEGSVDKLGEDLTGAPIAVSFAGAPLPAFINEVFNERLGLSFHISPTLAEKTDLVTLRSDPLPPSQLFATARRVLETYGVRIRGEEDGMLTFVASDDISTREIPLLISGRARPEVPATHRTIFQLVTLKVLSPIQVTNLLTDLVRGLDLVIHEKPERGALLLQGKLETVDAAVAMIEVFDQPLLIGRQGLVVEPVFLPVEDLAGDLEDIRAHPPSEPRAYGRRARRRGHRRRCHPAAPRQRQQARSCSPSTRRCWSASRSGRGCSTPGAKRRWRTAGSPYEVRHTLAERLTQTLDRIMGIDRETAEDAAGRAPVQGASAGQRLFVDEDRNLVFFKGSGKEWRNIRTMIEKLDKPVPSVLIEVLIAEVTLSDREESGIEYLGRFGIDGRTVDARLTGGGITFTLDGAGETHALLRLAFEDSRVVIRSRPRLVVKSGEQARLYGGTDIPVLSQRAEGTQVEGSTSIVQQIDYKRTGVTLDITPIVQANGLVDLTVSQELSETRATGAVSLTPSILTRQLNTSMTLRDGQSVLIGGLISESQTQGRSGVPGLGRLPVLGRLFRADSYQKDRTELLVMVIPYVIVDPRQGRELTEQVKSQLELHRRFL